MKTPLQKWWWIDFVDVADTVDVTKAKQAADKSERGILSKTLPFTEENFEFTLLYNHVRRGQIQPKKLRRLQRKYLDFIAGMEYPNPDIEKTDPHELMKLQGNVSRAKHELALRNLFWTTLITASAAIAGAFIGSLLIV